VITNSNSVTTIAPAVFSEATRMKIVKIVHAYRYTEIAVGVAPAAGVSFRSTKNEIQNVP